MADTEKPLSFLTSLRRTRHGNVGDVVTRLAEIHARLGQHYTEFASHTSDEGLQIALKYLAGTEAHLEDDLRRFLEDAKHKVLVREFKYVPDLDGDELVEAMDLREPKSMDDLSIMLQEVQKCIEAVYEPLSGASLPEDAEEAVNDLHAQEREHAIEQNRAITEGMNGLGSQM